MEKITVQQDDRLLDYLDGKLTDAEITLLKKQLEQSAILQHRLEELRFVHNILSNPSKAELPPEFTNEVMKNLDKAFITPGMLSPRNGLMLLCGILIAVGITILFLTTGFFDIFNDPLNLSSLSLPKGIINQPLHSIPVSGKTLMKLLIGLNIGIAFLVLDRTVLKPYFNRKNSTQSFS
jgi:hypothetical protein